MSYKQSKKNQSGFSQSGFSLIELGIALVITGLVVVTLMETHKQYAYRLAHNGTLEKKFNIEIALGRFFASNGRMPCPADPTLPPSHPQAGMENCAPDPDGAGPLPAYAFPEGGCSPGEGLCRIFGTSRQLGMHPSMNPGGGLPPVIPLDSKDPVLRGVVPYVTLSMDAASAIDAWGGMMGYAVTEAHANPAVLAMAGGYNKDFGTINILTWSDASGGFVEKLNREVTIAGMEGTTKSFSHAVVSYGPDNKGAFSNQGARIRVCDGEGMDKVNCRTNPSVIDGSQMAGSTFRDASRPVNVPGANFYDDAFVSDTMVKDSDKWTFASVVGGIRSKALWVGVGIEAPSTTEFDIALEVSGNLLSQQDIEISESCDHGDACFQPTIIGGANGLNCTGGVMTAVANAHPVCASQISLAGSTITGAVCEQTGGGVQLLLRGYCANGTPICRDPTTGQQFPSSCTPVGGPSGSFGFGGSGSLGGGGVIVNPGINPPGGGGGGGPGWGPSIVDFGLWP